MLLNYGVPQTSDWWLQQKIDHWPLSRFKPPLDPITELKKNLKNMQCGILFIKYGLRIPKDFRFEELIYHKVLRITPRGVVLKVLIYFYISGLISAKNLISVSAIMKNRHSKYVYTRKVNSQLHFTFDTFDSFLSRLGRN